MTGENAGKEPNNCRILELEEKMDQLTEKYRGKMLNRIRKGKIKEEVGILYSEMLTDFERIGDHAENIAQQYRKIYTNTID